MIVKDEAERLPRCLDSARDVVDEILVVDTGSGDRTPEIAQSYGAKVHSFAWCDDFAAARNASLQFATGEWILVLDADEILCPAIVPVLKQALQASDRLVITLLRQEMGVQQAPSLLSRLWRNRPEIRFSHPYHELIDDSVTAVLQREPHWQVVQLPGIAIQHTGYQAPTIAQRQKVDRARRLMATHLTTHPNDAYICSKLGALLVETADLPQGLELLHRGLAVPETPPPVRYELHYHLGDTYRQLQQTDIAEQHFQAAIAQPLAPQLKLGAYNNWGSLRLERGDIAGAKNLYETMVAIAPTFAIGYFNLGTTNKALGNLAEAIRNYEQAIALQPEYPEAFQNLGVIWLNQGNVLEGLVALRRAIGLYEQQGSPAAEQLRQGLKAIGFSG